MESLFLDQWNAFPRYFDFPGRAPPLVFLHGLGSASSADFPRTIRNALIAGFRSLLVDFLGHGFSDRPRNFSYSLEDHGETVALLLDHLSLKKVALFGQSMGGAIAITFAALRPELVSRLIIAEGDLDPGGGFISTPIAFQSEKEFEEQGRREILKKLKGWPTYAGTFQACASHGPYRSAVSLVRGTRPTMRERFIEMKIPRTYICGERSVGKDSLHDTGVKVLPEHGIQLLVVPKRGTLHDTRQSIRACRNDKDRVDEPKAS